MVTWTSRDLNEVHRLQYPTHASFIHRDGEFLPDPVPKVRQPPAHDAMDRRDWSSFNHRRQGLALRCVQLGRIARRLAVNQPGRPIRIETQDPVADHLQIGRPDPRSILAPHAIIYRRQRKQTAALARVFAILGNPTQIRSIKIFPQSNRSTPGDLPRRFTIIDSEIAKRGNH